MLTSLQREVLRLRLRSRLEELTHGPQRDRVEHALTRVDSAEFGTCVDCRLPIGWSSLAAAPEALLCARCANERERLHAKPSTGLALDARIGRQ